MRLCISVPAISEDLKTLILQRSQGVQSSKPVDEEIFDDIGTGEDLDELEDEEEVKKSA